MIIYQNKVEINKRNDNTNRHDKNAEKYLKRISYQYLHNAIIRDLLNCIN